MLAVLITFSVLIFPIFLSVKFHLSKEKRKLFFTIKIFGINIISGYAEIIEDGIIIHLTRKFAVIIPYTKIFDMRKTVEPLKDYHFIKVNTLLEIGDENSMLYPISTAFIINFFNNVTCWFIDCHKPYVTINNRINVYTDENKLEFHFEATVVFNLLMVVLSLIKILVGKINYAIAK